MTIITNIKQKSKRSTTNAGIDFYGKCKSNDSKIGNIPKIKKRLDQIIENRISSSFDQ